MSEHGYTLIRPVTDEDIPVLAQINLETRQVAYARFYPPDLIAKLTSQRSMQAWERALRYSLNARHAFAHVAEYKDGRVVGAVFGGPENRGDPIFRGEVYSLCVLPSYQRRGVGSRLLRSAANTFLASNVHNMLTWVLEMHPHRAFYESLG